MLYPLFLVKKKSHRYEKDPESHRLCAIKLLSTTLSIHYSVTLNLREFTL